MPDFSLLGASGPVTAFATPGNSRGVTVTGNVTPAVKGAWTELISATVGPGTWLHLVAILNDVGSALLDVGIGASTAEKVLVPDLYSHLISTASNTGIQCVLPLNIPAGSRISARIQHTGGGGAMFVSAQVFSGGMASSGTLGRVETGGAVNASQRGTQLDPGGTAHTDSAWVQLIAATGFPYRWMVIDLGHSAGAMAASAAWLIDLGIGASPNEKVLVPDIYAHSGNTTDSPLPASYSFPVNVPAGSRISARARSGNITATERVIDVVMHGVG